MKEAYERLELEIIELDPEDMITTSGPDDYEGWNPHSGEGGEGGESGGESGGSGSSSDYEGWNPH